MAKTLDFHLHAFAKPLPKPEAFTHADVYPISPCGAGKWTSDRRQPGFTVIENASTAGFRCAVREWAPGGSTIPEVKLSVTTPPRSFVPASSHPWLICGCATAICGAPRSKRMRKGRLSFDLDGDAWQVAIGEPAAPLVTGYEIEGASWATASQPVHLKVKFSNLASQRSATAAISW